MKKITKIFLVLSLLFVLSLNNNTHKVEAYETYKTIAKSYEYRIDTADTGKNYSHVHIYLKKGKNNRSELICLKIGDKNHVCDKSKNPKKSFSELPTKLQAALLAEPKFKFSSNCACGDGGFGGGGAGRPFFAKDKYDYNLRNENIA